ncbi:MAG: phosphate regulon transcriptional regulator PhoB [Gammaproteobacteria bacterium]|nr:phosphate regulon transcriptional regulator PhoB [Gammaproteobacteria bacterium]
MSETILIVEDEPAICSMLEFALNNAGYDCRVAGDAAIAQQSILDDPPLLILLDWMLPGLSGIDFARRLKQDDFTRLTPIIMLTAKGEEADKVKGLESGADDYLTKPFSPRELIARIKAVLRRTAPHATDETVNLGGLTLDPGRHRVNSPTGELRLGPTEFRLLHFFMTHPERAYSRSQLLDMVWGQNVYIEDRTVDVHIRRLREALSGSGHDRLVQTVRGTGYRFSVQN